MPVGNFRLGGPYSSRINCQNNNCLMNFTHSKTNDWYYKPGNRSSWARRSRSGGGQNYGRTNATRIGVNRLGG